MFVCVHALMYFHYCDIFSLLYPQIIREINPSPYFLRVRHNQHITHMYPFKAFLHFGVDVVKPRVMEGGENMTNKNLLQTI